MAKGAKKASTRTSTLDYAKRKVKAPTISPLGFSVVNPPKPVDYTKQRSIGVISGDGPLALEKLGRPKRPSTKIKW